MIFSLERYSSFIICSIHTLAESRHNNYKEQNPENLTTKTKAKRGSTFSSSLSGEFFLIFLENQLGTGPWSCSLKYVKIFKASRKFSRELEGKLGRKGNDKG